MRAVHVFPVFTRELLSGSDYYDYMLSRHLARQGVRVDVLATRTRSFHPTSAFSLEWPDELPAGGPELLEEGLTVSRFSASLRVPEAVGHAASRWVFRRWAREDARHGRMLDGSLRLPEHLFRCAVERPRLYGLVTSAGRGPVSLSLLRELDRRLDHADVVLTGFVPFSVVPQVVRLARRRGKPVIVLALFHPNDRYHYFHELFGAFARADCVLLQTPYVSDLLGRVLPEARTLVIGAGVEAEELYAPTISGARFRQRHGLGDAPLALYVGRKEPGKRYEDLIEAVGLARPDSRAVMIGRDIDGKRLSSKRILFLGQLPRSEVLDAYDACDAFVLPSQHESFGIVLLEAWMRGKPVLGNRACLPVASIIEDGVDGFLCGGPEDYAAALERVFGDRDLARRMGDLGRQKVLRSYTWEIIARKVRDLYEELAAEERSPAGAAAGVLIPREAVRET